MVSNDSVKAGLSQYFSFASAEFEIIMYFAIYDGDGGWDSMDYHRTIRLSGLSAT